MNRVYAGTWRVNRECCLELKSRVYKAAQIGVSSTVSDTYQ